MKFYNVDISVTFKNGFILGTNEQRRVGLALCPPTPPFLPCLQTMVPSGACSSLASMCTEQAGVVCLQHPNLL